VSIPIEKMDIRGNPNIGIYIFTNDRITIVPPLLEEKELSIIRTVLKTKIIITTIGGMNLVGILVAGNNKGLLLPNFVRDHEYEIIKREFEGNVAIVKSRYTALGNICLVNDRAALVHPEAYPEVRDIVKDVLEVETVEKGTIANIPTVGSAAYVNNRGGLVHPDADEAEISYLSQLFGVPIDIGTVNFGIGFIRSGLVANSFGIIVGSRTTGPEMMRIMQVFGGR